MNDEIDVGGLTDDMEHEHLHQSLNERFRFRKYQMVRRRGIEEKRAMPQTLTDQELLDYSTSIGKVPGRVRVEVTSSAATRTSS